MPVITVPYGFKAREYERPILKVLQDGVNGKPGGKKRAVAVWHRRAGKDLTLLNFTITAMVRRAGIYYHILPTYAQGKKIIWDGRDKEGRKFLDYFPPGFIKGEPNNSEMKIEMVNGSLWQVVGSDKVDSLVGTNPVGCVFSEYSLQNPVAWDLFRPILRENGGWAAFAYTPRGRNHGYQLYEMAKNNPEWFCQILTINDTGVLTPADVEEERRAGMPEELIQQEFYCSFQAPLVGSYYGAAIRDAREQGRICRVPHDPNTEVHTAWDLGVHDYTCIWFFQLAGLEVHMIDYYEGSGVGMADYARVLREKRELYNYVYGNDFMPHDIEVMELGSGRTRKEIALELGLNPVTVPRHHVPDGIEAVRALFSRLWIDEEKCSLGLSRLENYRREWSEKHQCFQERPVHDINSHGADALRTLAMGLRLTGVGRGGMTVDDLRRLEALYGPPVL